MLTEQAFSNIADRTRKLNDPLRCGMQTGMTKVTKL